MSESILAADLTIDWVALADMVAEEPQECGVFNDVNIAGTEEPEVPNAPFAEFPRLATMGDDELKIVVAVAERYVDLHHSALVIDEPENGQPDHAEPEEMIPVGMYSIVAQARAAATAIIVLTAPSGAQVSLRTTEHGFAMVTATSTDPASDAFGYLDINLASHEACAERSVAFVRQEGETTVRAWDRDGAAWHPRPLGDWAYSPGEISELVTTQLST